MFDLSEFVRRCRAASRQPKAQEAVAGVLREAVSQPGVWAACQHIEPVDRRGVARVFVDAHLTLVHVNLATGFASRVHDHGIWSCIGVYEGQEDNVLYRKDAAGVVPVQRVSVVGPDVFCMGADTIHHIENRQPQPLRALHCYGGDLGAVVRASYDLATGAVTPEGGARR